LKPDLEVKLTEVNIDHGQKMQRPVQARKLRTQAAILDAARAIVAQGGYGALRADKLAQAAGIAKGTIFAHYPDMDHLRAALVAEHLVPLVSLSPVRDVPGLLGAMVPVYDFLMSDAHVLPAVSRFSGPEGAGLGMAEAICDLTQNLARAIAGLQGRGIVGSGDPVLLADGVMAFTFHAAATALCAGGAGGPPAKAMLDALIQRWLDPVQPKPLT
jgi:TetR/AcrR family transcriptional regulator, fatty acid biosynthesis regulator